MEQLEATKQRAPRNKTLTLSRDEIEQLECNLLPIIGKPLSEQDITNQTIHSDLFHILEVLPKKFADLIIIDPPYNLNKDFHGLKFKSSDSDAYLSYLRSWLPQVVTLLKDSGSLYLCGDWKSTAALQTVLAENLFILNRITWQREKGRGAVSNWKNGMEDIWFAVKNSKDYYFNVDAVKMKRKVIAPYRVNGAPKDWEESEDGNFRLTYPSNFWDDISIPYWSMPENTDHPTQKPEKLIAKLILASCPEGGFVFDPFLGSGTTSIVAKKLGRRYCGIELNKDYCLWALKRLQKSDADNRIQGYTEGIFWERNSSAAQKQAATKNEPLDES
jgi:site-specific DNA-methyltransferase (adenine-specific)